MLRPLLSSKVMRKMTSPSSQKSEHLRHQMRTGMRARNAFLKWLSCQVMRELSFLVKCVCGLGSAMHVPHAQDDFESSVKDRRAKMWSYLPQLPAMALVPSQCFCPVARAAYAKLSSQLQGKRAKRGSLTWLESTCTTHFP
eukprot:4222237-Amphidinium_carterae.1